MAAIPGGSRASVRSRRSARPAPAVGPPEELAESSEPSPPRRAGYPPTADSPRRRSFLSRSFPARPDRSSRERRAESSAPTPGDAWKRLPGAPEAVEFYAITRASESASDLLVGSSGEIGRSFGLDGSWSWLPAPAVFGLTVDPAHPGSAFAATRGSTMHTEDGGITWQASSEGLTRTFPLQLALDQVKAATVYAATAGSGVFRSADLGRTWKPYGPELSRAIVRCLVADGEHGRSPLRRNRPRCLRERPGREDVGPASRGPAARARLRAARGPRIARDPVRRHRAKASSSRATRDRAGRRSRRETSPPRSPRSPSIDPGGACTPARSAPACLPSRSPTSSRAGRNLARLAVALRALDGVAGNGGRVGPAEDRAGPRAREEGSVGQDFERQHEGIRQAVGGRMPRGAAVEALEDAGRASGIDRRTGRILRERVHLGHGKSAADGSPARAFVRRDEETGPRAGEVFVGATEESRSENTGVAVGPLREPRSLRRPSTDRRRPARRPRRPPTRGRGRANRPRRAPGCPAATSSRRRPKSGRRRGSRRGVGRPSQEERGALGRALG